MRARFLAPLALLFIAFSGFSQISFKPGYYIDKQGNKVECFIKDVDSKYYPTSFTFRLSENGDNKTMKTEDIKEFVAGNSKYIHVQTRYDQSSQDIRKMGTSNNPDWVDGDLILQEIVSGKATLYEYSSSQLVLFFYSVDDSPIEQLVYKQYNKPGDDMILISNNTYIAQLNKMVRCKDQRPVNDKEVQYTRNSLAKVFNKFNECNGAVPVDKKKKNIMSIRLTPGVDFTTASANFDMPPIYDFGSNKSFRIGADFQFTLPFNHNKWAIFVEPTYSTFEGAYKTTSLKAKTLLLPIGIRHRFFVSKRSSIFVNGAAAIDVPINHQITFKNGETLKGDVGSVGATVGLGYSFGRLSLEGRYFPKWQRNEHAYTMRYTRSSVILGFRVF